MTIFVTNIHNISFNTLTQQCSASTPLLNISSFSFTLLTFTVLLSSYLGIIFITHCFICTSRLLFPFSTPPLDVSCTDTSSMPLHYLQTYNHTKHYGNDKLPSSFHGMFYCCSIPLFYLFSPTHYYICACCSSPFRYDKITTFPAFSTSFKGYKLNFFPSF